MFDPELLPEDPLGVVLVPLEVPVPDGFEELLFEEVPLDGLVPEFWLELLELFFSESGSVRSLGREPSDRLAPVLDASGEPDELPDDEFEPSEVAASGFLEELLPELLPDELVLELLELLLLELLVLELLLLELFVEPPLSEPEGV